MSRARQFGGQGSGCFDEWDDVRDLWGVGGEKMQSICWGASGGKGTGFLQGSDVGGKIGCIMGVLCLEGEGLHV
eukprot:320208-Ditylum_brightwellii.AAC.2